MNTTSNAAPGRVDGSALRPTVVPELLDARAVARLLACSVRHVYRLADANRMPRPIRLGTLVRWRRAELMSWLEDGCPQTRPAKAPAP